MWLALEQASNESPGCDSVVGEPPGFSSRQTTGKPPKMGLRIPVNIVSLSLRHPPRSVVSLWFSFETTPKGHRPQKKRGELTPGR